MKLPKGWKTLAMDMLGEVQAGRQRNPNITEGEMRPYLRVANVQDGWIDFSDINRMPFSSRELPIYELRSGDILLAEGQSLELVGRPAVYGDELPGCCFQNTLVRLRPIGQNPNFCYYVCYWQYVTGSFRRIAKQTTSIAHLGVSRFAEVVASIPPLPEQQKIADILGTWDEALEKLDALIAAKDRRKQALMQQLFTGSRRLPGSRAWKRVCLSDVAEESSLRNGEKLKRDLLYAVTKAQGMVPMRENVQGATINRCKIVERGWFAYNPMRINIGSIARWEGADRVMVSPDYVVFRADKKRLHSDYLNHLRRASPWADFVGAAGNGSVRVRIWFDDLGRFEFSLPSLDEQRAIAAVLDTADAELRLLRQQRAALNQQKRGLMQQLLTGTIRVNLS